MSASDEPISQFPPELLAGEELLLKLDDASICDWPDNVDSWIPGTLYLTNFQLFFQPQHKMEQVLLLQHLQRQRILQINRTSAQGTVPPSPRTPVPSSAGLVSSSSSGNSIATPRKSSPLQQLDNSAYNKYVVPYTMISQFQKSGGRKNATRPNSYLLTILTKDLRELKFSFDPNQAGRRKTFEIIKRYAVVSRIQDFFCFVHFKATQAADGRQDPPGAAATSSSNDNSAPQSIDSNGAIVEDPFDGWKIYSVEKEFKRQGLVFDENVRANLKHANNCWRISDINKDFALCDTYPAKLVVPKSLSDQHLETAAKFRSRGRLPTLTWYNPRTGTCLTRSSQPMGGVRNKSSSEDEELLQEIINSCAPSTVSAASKLMITDLRPKLNAESNRLMGKGYEILNATHYQNCLLRFFDIENIHVMRKSFSRLVNLCISTGGCDDKWLTKLDTTFWLKHIRIILMAAMFTANCLEGDNPSLVGVPEPINVLSHCSDGWDRTAQVVCLTQIFLDPYYRTIEGFAVLIEKDWLSFGHRFQTRVGHGQEDFWEDQRSPTFLQFIDAVWQLTQQFPAAFEFNEHFLLFILDSLYNCRFGTFLCESPYERTKEQVYTKTCSLWTYILQPSNRPQFVNSFYSPSPDLRIIYPDTNHSSLRFWNTYFLRYSGHKKYDPMNAGELDDK